MAQSDESSRDSRCVKTKPRRHLPRATLRAVAQVTLTTTVVSRRRVPPGPDCRLRYWCNGFVKMPGLRRCEGDDPSSWWGHPPVCLTQCNKGTSMNKGTVYAVKRQT